MWWDLWGYLSPIADWASLLSLVASGLALFEITRLRRHIIDRVRLPVLVASLRKHGKNFADHLKSYESPEGRQEFSLEIAKCETNLRLVRTKISRTGRQRADELLKLIKGYRASDATGDQTEAAWRIYTDLNGLLEELKNFVAEQRMGA